MVKKCNQLNPLKGLFLDRNKPSLKRISGSIMALNALLGKNILCCIAMFHTVSNFSVIDNSLDSLLYGGIGLVCGSIIDKWAPNAKTNTSSD